MFVFSAKPTEPTKPTKPIKLTNLTKPTEATKPILAQGNRILPLDCSSSGRTMDEGQKKLEQRNWTKDQTKGKCVRLN